MIKHKLLKAWGEALAASGASSKTIQIRLKTISALCNHAEVVNPLDLSRIDAVSFLGRDLAPWSRLTYYQSIRAWCEFLREFDIADVDLLKGVRKPPTPQPMARPISDATIHRLLELPLSPRPHAYIRIALYEALRVHEIAQLRGEHFVDGWLRVHGKGGIDASIPIHPEVLPLVDRFPEVGWWFPAASGDGHVAPEAVSSTIASALRMAGSDATAHQLRDTAATRLQREVGDIRVVQAMLRHQSVRSTQKYTQVADAQLLAAANQLDWKRAC